MNPEYWNTIATVIPVIALTYTTALRRRDWHLLTSAARRWTALYGAVLIGALSWAEWIALRHLMERSTASFDEAFSLIFVGLAAVQVLMVPVAPLFVLAVHDLHPKVVAAKRSLKKYERGVVDARREYDKVTSDIDTRHAHLLITGMEQVLRDPSLVYNGDGSVRSDYMNRVHIWSEARDYRLKFDALVEPVESRLRLSEADYKRAKKRLTKVLRKLTKRVVKATDLRHGA